MSLLFKSRVLIYTFVFHFFVILTSIFEFNMIFLNWSIFNIYSSFASRCQYRRRLIYISTGVHRTCSPAQPAGSARTRTATTRTDHSDGRRWVATHRTRTLRVGRRVSSPKTQATRPNHKSNKIRRDWKVFRQRATWNPPDLATFFIFWRRSTWNPPDSAIFFIFWWRSTWNPTDLARSRQDLLQIRQIQPNIG